VVSDYQDPGKANSRALEQVAERHYLKNTVGHKVFMGVNIVVLLLFSAMIIVPLLNILALSFSDSVPIVAGKVSLWPVGFNLFTFKKVVSDSLFWRQYANTILYTVLYTAIAMFLTTTFAYALSRKELKGRSGLTWVALFTMFFAPGIIPSNVLISRILAIHNTICAMVSPGTITGFNQ